MDYMVKLLQLALNRSRKNDESFYITPEAKSSTQGRLIANIKRGALDVIWTMTSLDREASMLPIRIPLLKGLLGQRVFLIKAEQQVQFDSIRTLQDLQQLTAGQGSHWPDTDILRQNGLRVVTSANYELLFTMLKGDRFDYFPRGLNEAWEELEVRNNEGIAVEKNLLLSYVAPKYFFVQKRNFALAKRITDGLEAMVKDGSFDNYFNNHPITVNLLQKADLKHRRIFFLENKALPPLTPIHDRRYWH